jgi:hypothetical protein
MNVKSTLTILWLDWLFLFVGRIVRDTSTLHDSYVGEPGHVSLQAVAECELVAPVVRWS